MDEIEAVPSYVVEVGPEQLKKRIPRVILGAQSPHREIEDGQEEEEELEGGYRERERTEGVTGTC